MSIRRTLPALTLISALLLSACQHQPETITQNRTESEVPANEANETSSTDNSAMNGFDMAYYELGRDIAQTRCAACHNAEPTGASPRADAPPLRHVLYNYNPEALANDFRERIKVGHPDMPDYKFSVIQIEGLLAYLSTIQEPPETAH